MLASSAGGGRPESWRDRYYTSHIETLKQCIMIRYVWHSLLDPTLGAMAEFFPIQV